MLPSQNVDAYLFHVEKTMNFMIVADFSNFMVLGPRPLGPWDLPFFAFFEILFYGLGPI